MTCASDAGDALAGSGRRFTARTAYPAPFAGRQAPSSSRLGPRQVIAPDPALRMPHQRHLAPLAATLAALLLIATPSADAAPPRLASAAAFRDSVGVGTHPSYYDTPYGQWNRVVARLRELGVHHIRGSFFASGNAGWNARQAQNFRTAYAAGIRVNVVLDLHCSPSGRVDPCLSGMKAELPRGSVESVEWPNEHDLFGGPGWKPVLQSWGRNLYRRVKADPVLRSLRVVGPSLVAPAAPAVLGDQSAYLDAGNLHPYTGGLEPQPGAHPRRAAADAPRVGRQAARGHRGRLPHLAVRDERQPPADRRADRGRLHAPHVPRALRRRHRPDVPLRAARPARRPARLVSNFGLLHADFSPKPAFTQLKRLLDMIGSSAPPSLTPLAVNIGGDTSDVRSLLLQQGAGRYALVLWRTASVWDRDARRPLTVAPRRVTVSVPQAATVAVGHPAAGTTEPAMPLRTRTLPLELAADPVVLLLHTRTAGPLRGGPRVSRLRVHHAAGRWWVTFRLSARARVRWTLHRRGHRVRRATTRALRPGRHGVGLGRLRAGRYRLRLAVAGTARPGARAARCASACAEAPSRAPPGTRLRGCVGPPRPGAPRPRPARPVAEPASWPRRGSARAAPRRRPTRTATARCAARPAAWSPTSTPSPSPARSRATRRGASSCCAAASSPAGACGPSRAGSSTSASPSRTPPGARCARSSRSRSTSATSSASTRARPTGSCSSSSPPAPAAGSDRARPPRRRRSPPSPPRTSRGTRSRSGRPSAPCAMRSRAIRPRPRPFPA